MASSPASKCWPQHALTHRLGRQWQRVLPGIYATTTGELATAQLWRAALLYGGESAMLGGPTAAAAYGLRTLMRISRIHVLLRHQVYRPLPGFVVVRRTNILPTWRGDEGGQTWRGNRQQPTRRAAR